METGTAPAPGGRYEFSSEDNALFLTWGTASSLRRIVDTEGSDISHLMAALGSLHNLLTLAVVLVTILLAVGASGILVTLFIAVFA